MKEDKRAHQKADSLGPTMVIASARKIEYATGAMRGRALTSNGDGENEGGEGEIRA